MDYRAEDRKKLKDGYVYLMDDGRDLKFGIAMSIKVRHRTYITENPQLICHDHFQAEHYKQAEEIEAELIKLTENYRTHGNEWCKRCDKVFQIWEQTVRKYLKLTSEEWEKRHEHSKLRRSLQVVAAASRKEFLKLRKNNKNQAFHFPEFEGLTLCNRTWFDGSVQSAKSIVLNHCQKQMEEHSIKEFHLGDDYFIVKSYQPHPVQRQQFQEDVVNQSNSGLRYSALIMVILAMLPFAAIVLCFLNELVQPGTFPEVQLGSFPEFPSLMFP